MFGVGTSISGVTVGGALWLVFFAGLAIVGSFFYWRSQGEFWRAKKLIFGSAMFGIIILIYKYVSFSGPQQTPFGPIKAETFGLSVGLGAIGAFLGLLIAL